MEARGSEPVICVQLSKLCWCDAGIHVIPGNCHDWGASFQPLYLRPGHGP